MQELKSIINTTKSITFGYLVFTVLQNTADIIKRACSSLYKLISKKERVAKQNVSIEQALVLLPAGDQLAVRDAMKMKEEGKELTKAQIRALANIADTLDKI